MSNEQNILELCKYRFQQADGALFIPSEHQCREALEHAQEFVKRIREYFDHAYGQRI